MFPALRTGFDLRKRVDTSGRVTALHVTGLATHLPFYGLPDLRELLALIAETDTGVEGVATAQMPRPAAVRSPFSVLSYTARVSTLPLPLPHLLLQPNFLPHASSPPSYNNLS